MNCVLFPPGGVVVKKKKKERKKANRRRQKFNNLLKNSLLASWEGGRVTNKSYISVINSHKILHRAISHQNEYEKAQNEQIKRILNRSLLPNQTKI